MAEEAKITINVAFHDEIQRLIVVNKALLSKNPVWSTKDVYITNEASLEQFQMLSKKCNTFFIEDSEICFNINKTEEEIKEETKNYFKNKEASKKMHLTRLKRWCENKEESNVQIMAYLQHRKLEEIIEDLNNIN